jgi:hypothetical protein
MALIESSCTVDNIPSSLPLAKFLRYDKRNWVLRRNAWHPSSEQQGSEISNLRSLLDNF